MDKAIELIQRLYFADKIGRIIKPEDAEILINSLIEGKNYKQAWEELENLAECDIVKFYREQMNFIKKRHFPEPCSKIKQLEQFKAEFVKSEHSYYMERFMETCIKLFKEYKYEKTSSI